MFAVHPYHFLRITFICIIFSCRYVGFLVIARKWRKKFKILVDYEKRLTLVTFIYVLSMSLLCHRTRRREAYMRILISTVVVDKLPLKQWIKCAANELVPVCRIILKSNRELHPKRKTSERSQLSNEINVSSMQIIAHDFSVSNDVAIFKLSSQWNGILE